jgi:hypothetical protein
MPLEEWNQETIIENAEATTNTQISHSLTYTESGSPADTARGHGPWFGRHQLVRVASTQFGVVHEPCPEASRARYAIY